VPIIVTSKLGVPSKVKTYELSRGGSYKLALWLIMAYKVKVSGKVGAFGGISTITFMSCE